MSPVVDWISTEETIIRLLPSEGRWPDRELLLREVSRYAQQAVVVARRLGPDVPTPEQQSSAVLWLEHPVFICGHHRSGTTLLQQLLDGHPQLVVLPSEGTYLSSFRYVARRDPGPQDVDRFLADWIARLIDPNQEPHFKLGRSAPHLNPYVQFARRFLGWAAVLQQTPAALAPFLSLRALIAAYRDAMESPVAPRLWVEKTPLNEHNAKRFLAFPEARFIQLVREPAATLASLAEAYRRAGSPEFNTAAHARAIARSLRFAAINTRRLSSRYRVVRYEDLTGQPACEMEKVRTFLGIPSDPSLLTPSVGGQGVRSNSSFNRGRAGVIEASPHPASLSPADTRLLGAIAGSAAQALGYELQRPGMLARSLIHLAGVPAGALRVARRVSSIKPSADTT